MNESRLCGCKKCHVKREGCLQSEHGLIFIAFPLVLLAILAIAGLSYDGYRIYRENEEQNRLARSIGIATLKAYKLAGCEFDWDENNSERIKFAIRAAIETMDVEGNHTPPEIVMTSRGTTGPVEVEFRDDTGSSRGSAKIRIGKVNSKNSVALGQLQPCSEVPASPGPDLLAGTDTWRIGETFQWSLLPSHFNWVYYILSNQDVRELGIDSKIESERHFALAGINEQRLGTGPVLVEPHEFVAVEVALSGISSSSRIAGLAKLFGVDTLPFSTSKVVVVHEENPVQVLQSEEIEISSSPVPRFNPPSGLKTSRVFYTMSMDLRIGVTGNAYRSIFNSGSVDYNSKILSRCPALFITPEGAIQISHCGTHFHDRRFVTEYKLSPGVPFNLTWTVEQNNAPGRLWENIMKVYVNGKPALGFVDEFVVENGENKNRMSAGLKDSLFGHFQWTDSKYLSWNWNAYLQQYPGREGNTQGSVRVKNVLWWNRPLSASEVLALQSNKPRRSDSPYRIIE